MGRARLAFGGIGTATGGRKPLQYLFRGHRLEPNTRPPELTPLHRLGLIATRTGAVHAS